MKPNFTAGIVFLLCFVAIACESHAGTVTFGSGANTFSMEFVTIGSAGNAPDTTGNPNPAGSVGYVYEIGKFEVSEDMIAKYNSLNQDLQISKDARGLSKPATSVSWNEAARFVNWLNTSTGGFAAYKFTTSGVNDNIALWTASDTLDYDPSNPFRSKRAAFVLPSYNEWYKAAYFNPSNSTYYDYPKGFYGNNVPPIAVASGTADNTAVYLQSSSQDPADVNQAGGVNANGVMGLGGNVFEWEETSVDLTNSNGASTRGVRGGSWKQIASTLSSSSRLDSVAPSDVYDSIGFRVAMVPTANPVPEPSMMMIGTLVALGGLVGKRRVGISKPRRIEFE